MNKLIVYGDIHSYYDELVRFRQKTNPKKNDMEVFITRGKDSIKTLRYLRTQNYLSILMGKYLGYLDLLVGIQLNILLQRLDYLFSYLWRKKT
jgi:hypothetical protein